MSKTVGVSLFALLVASSAQAQQIGDVFYIARENHNFAQPSSVLTGTPERLFGNPAAPFLNSLVTPGNPNAAMVSYASNYQNISPSTHPSEPNYSIRRLASPARLTTTTSIRATLSIRPI